mgnify:CR=1 FL=1
MLLLTTVAVPPGVQEAIANTWSVNRGVSMGNVWLQISVCVTKDLLVRTAARVVYIITLKYQLIDNSHHLS